MLKTILSAYGFNESLATITAFGAGLINNTWKITAAGNHYILQRINDAIFKRPEDIANNIGKVAAYLKEHYPGYQFVSPVKTTGGNELIHDPQQGYFRMFPFVKGSHTKDVVTTASEAYEAAKQFGRFTRLLTGIDLIELKITIPDFHNLSLRYQQFLAALENGNRQRIAESAQLINDVKYHASIVKEYEMIIANPAFRLRITHHDTKISNVLFDETDKGICVIDLDTIMPGHFISDVGDMMRTYLSPVNEDEKDFSKIKIREDFYTAIVAGYFNEMKDELTETERSYFFYAGKFMIYMQALRFITDHINDDVYYGAKYPGHNFVRAGNQMVLLKQLIGKEALFSSVEEKPL